jgi:hypothetical protein
MHVSSERIREEWFSAAPSWAVCESSDMSEATGVQSAGVVVVDSVADLRADLRESCHTDSGGEDERNASVSNRSIGAASAHFPGSDTRRNSLGKIRTRIMQQKSFPPEALTKVLKSQSSITMQDPKLFGHQVLFRDHVFSDEDWRSHTSFRRFLPEPIVMCASWNTPHRAAIWISTAVHHEPVTIVHKQTLHDVRIFLM